MLHWLHSARRALNCSMFTDCYLSLSITTKLREAFLVLWLLLYAGICPVNDEMTQLIKSCSYWIMMAGMERLDEVHKTTVMAVSRQSAHSWLSYKPGDGLPLLFTRPSPPFDQYQIILLTVRDTYVWTTCLEMLQWPKVEPATYQLQLASPKLLTIKPRSHRARWHGRCECFLSLTLVWLDTSKCSV